MKLRCYYFFKKVENTNCKKEKIHYDFPLSCEIETEVPESKKFEYFPVPIIYELDGNNHTLLENYVGNTVYDTDGKNEFNKIIQVTSSPFSSSFSSSSSSFSIFLNDFIIYCPSTVNAVEHGKNICKLFLPLFRLLVIFSKVGMVHRDIRESNITIKDEQLYLLDYGFACAEGVETNFSGGISCASDDVLNKLKNKNFIFSVHNGDDIFSLIRVITVLLNKNIKKNLDEIDRYDSLNKVADNLRYVWEYYFLFFPDYSIIKNVIYSNDGAKIMENLILQYPICFNIKAIRSNETDEDLIFEVISEVYVHILGVLLDDIIKFDFSKGKKYKANKLFELDKIPVLNSAVTIKTPIIRILKHCFEICSFQMKKKNYEFICTLLESISIILKSGGKRFMKELNPSLENNIIYEYLEEDEDNILKLKC
jgi:serine/threonine protein kinase